MEQKRSSAKKSPRRLQFVVEIDQPEDATITDVHNYIDDAVGTWCGQLRPPEALGDDDPGDPLWNVGKTVRVNRLTLFRLHTIYSNFSSRGHK